MKSHFLNGAGLALCAIAFWSTNATVAHWLLETNQLSNVQLLQFIGAMLVFFFLKRKGPTPAAGVRLRGAVTGVLGLVGTMVFQYIAFATAPVIQANIIAYSWPLLLAISHVLLGQSSSSFFLLTSAVLGFVGVSMVSGIASASAVFSPIGYSAAAISAICMASYSYLVGSIEAEPRDVLLPAATIGVLGCLIWVAKTGFDYRSATELMAGLYLGAGPMGLGYLLWSLAMIRDSSGHIAVLGYLTPVTSSLLLWVTGSHLSAIALVGAMLVITSCAAIGWQQTVGSKSESSESISN
ncbi:DMT family transporter [Salinisphaera japonica]|uniref:Membrane protein n=1 Tax=Salinisphaera japonica YTM-1 TaxID=1209778 RepID=A0A423PJ43_9GAMM|nr:DMT family transporter [Salinisphaera japonica]ROO25609.1 membrane protein [Salinisphaera japonica YTM-1]